MRVKNIKGFSIVELLITIGIFTVLVGIASISLVKPQTQNLLDSDINTLISDIKAQQLKAMSGIQCGIYFSSNKYTLFNGSSYIPANANNFDVILQSNSNFSTIAFPSSTLLFDRLSGEVSGFSAGADNVVVGEGSGLAKTVTVNRYGAVTIN